MKHDQIVARLHAAHVEHTGVIQPVIDCGQCAMYAEWVAPLIAEAEEQVRLAVWHYCEVSRQTAEENPGNPYAVGLAKGYRDIQEKLAQVLTVGSTFLAPAPEPGSILDDVDGDLAEQEDIVRARAAGSGYRPWGPGGVPRGEGGG